MVSCNTIMLLVDTRSQCCLLMRSFVLADACQAVPILLEAYCKQLCSAQAVIRQSLCTSSQVLMATGTLKVKGSSQAHSKTDLRAQRFSHSARIDTGLFDAHKLTCRQL